VEGHRVGAGEIEGKVCKSRGKGCGRGGGGGVLMTPLRVQMETRKVHAAAQGPQWDSGHMRHVRVMSPPWTMNPGMMRWKREVLVARSVHTHTRTHTNTDPGIHARSAVAVKYVRRDVAAKTGNRSSQSRVPDHGPWSQVRNKREVGATHLKDSAFGLSPTHKLRKFSHVLGAASHLNANTIRPE
jgi:hypothetical protein